jgi:hypothetical protein
VRIPCLEQHLVWGRNRRKTKFCDVCSSINLRHQLRKTTENVPRRIRWNISSTLEDLDFADDLALLSQTHHHLQEKTNRISNFVLLSDLKIFLALLSLFMMSFPAPPSFLTVLPRYVNVSVFGRYLPSTCIGVGLVMFKVITSVV